MNTLVDKLFGIENTAEILDVRIVFNFGIPGWLVVFILIGIAIYCFKIYQREAQHVSKPKRGIMATLRFIVYVFLILAFLQPSIVLDRMIEPKSNLAVVLDTSQSMTIVEKGASDKYLTAVADVTKADVSKVKTMRRDEVVASILNNKDLDLLNQLSDKYSLKFYGFDRTAVQQDIRGEEDGQLNLPESTGNVTQLGAAVRQVMHDLKGHPLAGMVIFTDGGSNKGEDPEVAALDAGNKDVRLFPVGIGMPEAVDIKIVEVRMPDLIFKDEDLAVEVIFEASGLEGVSIPVELNLGDSKVGSGEVVAQEGRFSQSFVIRAKNKGDYTLTTSAEKQADEYYIANNIMKKQIKVIDSAIRVLIAVENPSWEYRYLKGLLDTDKRIETHTFIRRGDPKRSRSDEDFLTTFPFEELNKSYDVIIMNNIRSNYFNSTKMKKIQEFISRDGGSLIMISSTSGTPGTFVGTPIGDMLPVSFTQIPEEESLDLDNKFTRGYRIKLTREGRFSNVTRLLPLPDENEKLWPELPEHYWYYTGIKRLKPTAVALVEHASATNEYGPIPLMAMHRFGKGQVLFLGFNSIWRWRYKVGNKYTNRFWAQTIQFMGLPHLLGNAKRVSFDTQGRDFTVGEKIDTSVKVLTTSYTPLSDETITLIAQDKESGDTQEFTFQRDLNKDGYYNGGLILKKGLWNVTVAGHEREETLVLNVADPRFEFEKPAMQKKALTAMAKSSGGTFIELPELNTLVDKIKESVKLTRNVLEKTIWDTWFMLLIIVLAASTEWFIRKNSDLP